MRPGCRRAMLALQRRNLRRARLERPRPTPVFVEVVRTWDTGAASVPFEPGPRLPEGEWRLAQITAMRERAATLAPDNELLCRDCAEPLLRAAAATAPGAPALPEEPLARFEALAALRHPEPEERLELQRVRLEVQTRLTTDPTFAARFASGLYPRLGESRVCERGNGHRFIQHPPDPAPSPDNSRTPPVYDPRRATEAEPVFRVHQSIDAEGRWWDCTPMPRRSRPLFGKATVTATWTCGPLNVDVRLAERALNDFAGNAHPGL